MQFICVCFVKDVFTSFLLMNLHMIIISDSLWRFFNEHLWHEWLLFVEASNLRELLWTYCLHHVGVCRNKGANLLLALQVSVAGT